ncbi:MAG TPA: acetate--CoA ligase family protein [Burkholderiales bacterium]|nr:acetate--CoA ligase family protein [Burkholderiales bacterium]
MAIPPVPTPRHDLTRFLHPRAIAVIGASNDLSRIGGQPLRLLTEFGYQGQVYPVNPKYSEIKGLPCYPDIAAAPTPCDVALIALSAPLVPNAIAQCGKAGVPFAIVLSAGFSEVGSEGKALQSELLAAAREHGVRVVGPNCLGLMNLADNVRIGFGGTMQLKTLRPGPIAMVTQSGGFGFGVAAIACYYGLGFNYIISTGNEADLSMLDWIADLIERPEVEIVTVFMEGITDGRRLIEIGERALELGKPVLIWKVGNTDVGSRAATSHTARMTAGYELYRAAFRGGGFIEIEDVDDLIDICKVFRAHKLPAGNRVAVLTLSGGAGVLLADRCVEHGLELPKLSAATTAKLREIMVSFASADNPIDATAHGYNDNFASYSRAIREVLADPNIDQAIARVPRGRAARPWAEGLIAVMQDTAKPLVLNWPTAPDDNGDVMQYLEQNNVPCILAPGRAVHALAALNGFAAKKRAYAQRAGHVLQRPIAPQKLRWPQTATTLGEHHSKHALKTYGVPVVEEVLMQAADVEMLTRCSLPFPLAVKLESPDIPHKTEAGVVRLDIRDLDGLKHAVRDIMAAANHYKPDARIDGILLQQMAEGFEVIVGAVNDPFFGPVVAFGLGGVFAELLKDLTYRFAPFDRDAAKEMIAEIKGAALLSGYRGRPVLDTDALADVLARVSLLINDHADRIAEIDINPLFVRPAGRGVVAADALIVLKARSRKNPKTGT